MRRGYLLAVLLAGAQLTGAQTTRSGQDKSAAKTPPVADTSDITIARKPGQEGGEAEMTVNAKVRKIAPHAVEAWKVRGSAGALVLVVEPPRATRQSNTCCATTTWTADGGGIWAQCP